MSGFFTKGRPLSLESDKDELKDYHVMLGRVAMLIWGVVGCLPLFGDPSSLSATTVSGTVVMGLGPPIYMLAVLPKGFFSSRIRPLAFHVPFWSGVIIAVVYQVLPQEFKDLHVGPGSYSLLLGINIVGAVAGLCFFLAFSQEWCFFSSSETSSSSSSSSSSDGFSEPLVSGAPKMC
eukprot:768476-Hanusia_phi.AAC.3